MMRGFIEMRKAVAISAAVLFAQTAYSMSGQQKEGFNRILHLSMDKLTEEAAVQLEKKYPNEDWSAYKFPQYVYTNGSVEVAYKISVKRPALLSKITCACFCKFKGHKNLLYCFREGGKAGGKFDSHASGCNVCYRQAMMAFLWDEAGFTEEQILQGMQAYASS